MLTGSLLLLAAYLIGSIPFPILVSKFVLGIDLRQHGSGNMGALNAGRVLGKKWFPVVFGLDLAKGAVATYLANGLLPEALDLTPTLGAALGGLLVVVGHCFPVFVGFKGGVGLAASAGALLILSPAMLAATAAVIVVGWALSRNMYVGVAGAALAFPLLAWLILKEPGAVAALAAWGLVVFWLHLGDLRAWWAKRKG